MADVTIKAAIDSSAAQRGALAFNSALSSMRVSAQQTANSVFSLQGAIGGLVGAFSLKALLDAGDKFQMMKDRFAMFAKAGESATGILEGLNAAAARSNAPVGALADIYNRNAAALQAMGKNASDGIRMSETLYKALVVSGNATESGTAALRQFSQSLDSGTVRGEEFNSVNEQATEIIRILSRETGASAAQLRKWANEGKLSAEFVFAALESGAADLDTKFQQMNQTVGQAGARFTDTFSQVVGQASEASGANREFANAINEWSDLLKSNEGLSLVTSLMEGLKKIAEFAGAAASNIRELKNEMKAREQAGQKGWFEWLLGDGTLNDTGVAGSAMGKFYNMIGLGNPFTPPGSKSAAFAKQSAVAVDLKGSILSDETVAASAPGKKSKEELLKLLGKGDTEAERKRREKLRAEMAKNLEQEKLRIAITQAQIAGDGALEQKLRNQLEIRSRITDDMRKASPEKAAMLEREIEQMNMLETVLRNQQEMQARNKEFADAFASTISGAFENAITGGKSFLATLRDIAKQLALTTAKAAIFDPMQKNLSAQISGGLKAGGFDIGNLFGGGGGDVGLGSWAPTIAFADGGVLSGPREFTARAGENGDEALLPLSRAGNGRLGVLAQGVGGTTITNTFHVGGDVSGETVERLRGMVRSAIADAAPGIVESSVYAVRDEIVRDRDFTRR